MDLSIVERAKRRVLGSPEKIPRRVLVITLATIVAIGLGGVFLATRSEIASTGGSLPYLRPILQITTSVWAYVAVLAFLLRRIIFKLDEMKADQAADVTGYEPRSVRRLKYEAESVDGKRVIVTSEDEPEEIRERILEKTEEGAEDDTMSINPDALGDLSDEERVLVERAEELGAKYDKLEARADALQEDLDDGIDEVLSAEMDPERVLSLEDDVVAPIDLLADEDREKADELEKKANELENVTEKMQLVAEEIDEVLEELQDDERDEELPAVPVELEADVQEDDGDEWREQYKLFRLDLATSLDFNALLWQLAVPAFLTSALILLAVQLWVKPWFYPVIFAIGAFVGIINYLRISWKRSRRLSSLRTERETVSFNDVSIPVKEVELPETRMYFASLPGKRYAHDDREVFADEIAYRAYELVNDVPVSPSIMEKQATQLKEMQPDLHGFRDDERDRIAKWLLSRVEATPYGLIPKAKLIEDCVEHDIQSRRFAPGRRGVGYDPEIVNEVYRALVPAAFVEQEIEIEDDKGEPHTLTAVRLRTDPVPPSFGEIRAQFSSQFSNYARWDAMYELPDVSDKLNEEPVYAGSIWGTP